MYRLFSFFVSVTKMLNSKRQLTGIPGTVGAIDSNLIQIQAPLHHSESYVCRKKFYALQLQVVSE